jgi:DNA-binding NarL/FixJ family response regulator
VIRVLIAEDQNLVRQGLRTLFERTGEMEVVGEASNGQEAVEQADRLRPDIVVMDLRMPVLNGDQAIIEMRNRSLTMPVIILSMYGDEIVVRQALQSGARGYLLKSATMEQMQEAVHQVAAGQVYVSPGLAGLLESVQTERRRYAADTGNPFDRLSARERQVLKMMIEGYSTRAIAETLKLSVKTVEKHRTNLAAKLQARDTATLVRLAFKHRWIPDGELPGSRVDE